MNDARPHHDRKAATVDTARLDELVSSLWALAELVEVRAREAKRVDVALRQASSSHQQQVEERLFKLRDVTMGFIERQLRHAMSVAAGAVAEEPSGASRTAAQRMATLWASWQRGASAQSEVEWVSSQRAVAEASSKTLHAATDLVRQQNALSINTLTEVGAALAAVHEQLTALSQTLNLTGLRPPVSARRSAPKAGKLSTRPKQK